MTNPNVKKGDRILLKVANNGQNKLSWEGKILEVVRSTTDIVNGSIVVKHTDGTAQQTTLFYRGPGDVFCLADRKEQAKYIRTMMQVHQNEIKEMKKEVDFLEKYESDEEFLATKLDKLMKTKGVKAKTEILKELKASNLL